MMDMTALNRIQAPQQVQQNQIVSPVSLGTGVMGHSCCTKGGERQDWSWATETRRVPKSWAVMPPVRPSWYQSGKLYCALTHAQ